MNIRTINSSDEEYPALIKASVVDAPPRLYALGADINNGPLVAVVGSRKPTRYGRLTAEKLAGELARHGLGIVSGLALGIDGLAHQAALEAGGYTLAVMPAGLDNIYPASHRELAKSILKNGGTLLSEYPAGVRADKYHFPARNRLISGLCAGVLIIEAAEKSGSLITAEHALDQGKTVMAVPGNIDSPLSFGTNRLLQIGAYPITSAADVFSALGLAVPKAEDADIIIPGDETDLNIVKALNGGAKSAAGLGRSLKLKPAE